MKDQRGLYYHPNINNKKIRVYVRKTIMGIEFRLWNTDDPQLWKDHGWVPYDAIAQAKTMYRSKSFNPEDIYNLDLATELIADKN
ncbi:MAG: hypothetical protein HKM93_04780 [Desulfobacteraceae bacterium]|nr:hypothetical protein [Desulfobacteraceae bacterium]